MLTGMMSELPAKNCWTLAEHAGDRSPDATQHLLASAGVDEDGLRDDLFITLVLTPIRAVRHRMRWSHWRRRHQYRARRSHYQRRTRL
jgi:hypothetical protein